MNSVWSIAVACYSKSMFCKPRPGKKIESMASILILGGVIPLCVAIIAQYRFHLPPCHFCMLQRYPYVIAIFMGIASLLVKRNGPLWRLIVVTGVAAFMATGVLGLFHTGIEQGWITYESGCVVSAANPGSLEALRAQILNAAHVSCSDAMTRVLGLSMASWNSVFAFSMVGLWLLQYRFEQRPHARQP